MCVCLPQEFELPCPPLELWSRFLASHSDFFSAFHSARGDSGVRLSKWQRHFKVPWRGPWGWGWGQWMCVPAAWGRHAGHTAGANPGACVLCCIAVLLCCVQVGLVRDLQFVTPLKFKLGPPQSLCSQTQRVKVCAGGEMGRQSLQRVSCHSTENPGSTLLHTAAHPLLPRSPQVFTGQHMVLETSQVMSDIPYSDSFR